MFLNNIFFTIPVLVCSTVIYWRWEELPVAFCSHLWYDLKRKISLSRYHVRILQYDNYPLILPSLPNVFDVFLVFSYYVVASKSNNKYRYLDCST
jgi:hypothetical protein